MSQMFDAADARVAQAEAVLAQLGLDGVTVEVTGQEREIAVLAAPEPQAEELLDARRTAVVAKLKALGFRYVALDLHPRR
jgi:PP-loop superfamily ATP-utilizing enzyme